MDDKKTMNPMNEEALNDVAGGANYDYYGNPINNYNCAPGPMTVPTNPVSMVNPGLSCSIKNASGATYVCPSCGSTRFKIRSANDQQINLQCKDCGTKFTVANV